MKKIDLNAFKPPVSAPRCEGRGLETLGSAVSPSLPSLGFDNIMAHLQSRFPDKLAFSLEEVAAMLGIDYETVRRRVADGSIASIPFGRRRLIPIQELAHILTTGVP